MSEDVYKKLAAYLDSLPNGFPATESGVELRILKRLFDPEEAAMALNLRLGFSTAEQIAERAGQPVEKTAALLHQMARKGLAFSIESEGKAARYMVAQFVVGMWEYHVKVLDEGFARDMAEYTPHFTKEAFDKLPQLRTIPVNRSLTAEMNVMPFDQAGELIGQASRFAVAPCICRKEHKLTGHGCDRLEDACLVFDLGADYYLRNGIAREISKEECLDILKKADEEGLVFQPGNTQNLVNICLCCGDCCQALLALKRHPKPAEVAVSGYYAVVDEDACVACGTCVERCQMEAITVEDLAVVDLDRCIGCGLCVTTCPSEAIKLFRKPEEAQPFIPQNTSQAFGVRHHLRQKGGTVEDALAALKEKAARHKAAASRES